MRNRVRSTVMPCVVQVPLRYGSGSLVQSFLPSYSTWFGGGDNGPPWVTKSSILDQVSPKGTRRYNPCSHLKNRAAMFTNVVKPFTVFDWGLNTTLTCRLTINGSFLASPPTIVPSTEHWGDLLDQLASSVSGQHNSAAMLPVTLWEAVKTIEMLRNPFNLLKPNWRRKVRKLTARDLCNKSSSIWLEGYYGWKSMFQDISQVATAAAEYLYGPAVQNLQEYGAERFSFTKNVKHAQDSVRYTVGTTASEWNYWYQTNQIPYFPNSPGLARLVDVNEQVSYTLGCNQIHDAYQRIQQANRLLRLAGVSNWRDVRDCLWEVVPFSFVIDWFVNTRGIWAKPNMWRLQQTDIKNVGFSTRSSTSYHVEILPGSGFLKRNSWLDTAYIVLPSTNAGSVIKTTESGLISSYSRQEGFPSVAPVDVTLASHGLKRIQCANGAALLLQQFFKP